VNRPISKRPAEIHLPIFVHDFRRTRTGTSEFVLRISYLPKRYQMYIYTHTHTHRVILIKNPATRRLSSSVINRIVHASRENNEKITYLKRTSTRNPSARRAGIHNHNKIEGDARSVTRRV